MGEIAVTIIVTHDGQTSEYTMVREYNGSSLNIAEAVEQYGARSVALACSAIGAVFGDVRNEDTHA